MLPLSALPSYLVNKNVQLRATLDPTKSFILDEIAKDKTYTIAPLNKSNYVCITDMTMLKQLNPKRTI